MFLYFVRDSSKLTVLSNTEGTVPLPSLTNEGELNQEILPGLKMVLQMSSILL